MRPMLNDLFLRHGRFPSVVRPDEIVVSEAFALCASHARRSPRRGDQRQAPRLGSSASRCRPNTSTASVLASWCQTMRDSGLSGCRGGACGGVQYGGGSTTTLTLLPGASEPDVIARLDRLLNTHGGLGAYRGPCKPRTGISTTSYRSCRASASCCRSSFCSSPRFSSTSC